MKKIILLSAILLSCISVMAQLTIEECYVKAQSNYPLIKQYGLIEKIREYNLSNAGKGYLPQLSFSAKATYQSDVTEIPIGISIPGFDGVSNDQYNATLDIKQVIWDGGTISSRKESIRTSSEVDKKNLEVDLYSVNERVNQVFFGALLLDAQIAQNKLYREDLQRSHEKLLSWIQNGIANQSDLDAVKVEQLQAKQNEIRLIYTQKTYLDVLSALIGEDISTGTILVKPQPVNYQDGTVQRPELGLFNAQIRNLQAQNDEIKAGLMPQLGVFVTGGYGRPGLNMLNDDFSTYYLAGINLTWNFSNLYSNKNNKLRIQTNIISIQTRQETFLFNTNLDISQKQNEISRYRDQLKYDDEIIALRNSIKQSSEVKIANGTISGIDFMRDITAEEFARQDKILHEIEMLSAIYNLIYTTNSFGNKNILEYGD